MVNDDDDNDDDNDDGYNDVDFQWNQDTQFKILNSLIISLFKDIDWHRPLIFFCKPIQFSF